MIKINLALKKQSGLSGGKGGFKIDSFASSMGMVRGLPIKRILIPCAIGFLASFGLDYYEEQEVQAVAASIQKLRAASFKVHQDVAKMKEYEPIKSQVESDEKEIGTKLNTIRALMSDRTVPLKVLKSFSSSIPSEVWLNVLKAEGNDVQIKGGSFGFNQISDFMKALKDGPAFEKVELASSHQENKDAGGDTTVFELRGKRRENK